MAKLKLAGCYIHDFPPVTIIENDISEDRLRELVKHHLGTQNLEWEHPGQQIFLNKGFVDLGLPNADGVTLALYNHDGKYSLRTYKKRPRE